MDYPVSQCKDRAARDDLGGALWLGSGGGRGTRIKDDGYLHRSESRACRDGGLPVERLCGGDGWEGRVPPGLGADHRTNGMATGHGDGCKTMDFIPYGIRRNEAAPAQLSIIPVMPKSRVFLS